MQVEISGSKGRERLVRQVDELSSLYRLTDRLYRARTAEEVFDAALDAITETLGCQRASILLFDEEGVMRFVAWRGLSDGYRAELEGHSPWKAGEPEPQPIFVRDISDTDEPDRVKQRIRQENIRGLAFIPLVAQGVVIGKFMTYYAAPHAFTEHEIDMAVTIARQVGFSIERRRAEEARHVAEEERRHSEERFRLMAEHAPVMIWTSDETGRCLHLNAMLREFWGVDEASFDEFDWQSTIHPEDAPEIGRQMLAAMTARTSVTVRGRYLNAAGEYRVLRTLARPYFSAWGELRGMIGVNTDITERERAEQALRESEERFRMAVEAAPSGMVMTDAGGRIVLVNAQAEELFGYAREELIGQPMETLVPERYRNGHPDYREAYGGSPNARRMGEGRDLFALRKDGSEVPVEIGLSPIRTAEGMMTLAAVVDISERKRSEQQRDLLLAELNHRVKNTLAVVQGIANQTFGGGGATKAARAAFDGRLLALAAAHNLLTSSNWESAPLGRLAADSLAAQGTHQDRVRFDGPPVLLPPRQALAIAMGLHELCTNAFKYGALSTDTGSVSLCWTRGSGPEARLAIVWREEGGPAVTPPGERGFGTRLIERMLAQDLDATVTLDFRPEGLVCTIDAPLPRG